jgi:hypothetical protein
MSDTKARVVGIQDKEDKGIGEEIMAEKSPKLTNHRSKKLGRYQ